jgi:hypothetical protein
MFLDDGSDESNLSELETTVENGVEAWAEKVYGDTWRDYVAYTMFDGVRQMMVVPPWIKEKFTNAIPNVLCITPVDAGVLMEYTEKLTADEHRKYVAVLKDFASKFKPPYDIEVKVPDTVVGCHTYVLVVGMIPWNLWNVFDEEKVEASLEFFRWIVYDVGLAMEMLKDIGSDAALKALLTKDYTTL